MEPEIDQTSKVGSTRPNGESTGSDSTPSNPKSILKVAFSFPISSTQTPKASENSATAASPRSENNPSADEGKNDNSLIAQPMKQQNTFPPDTFKPFGTPNSTSAFGTTTRTYTHSGLFGAGNPPVSFADFGLTGQSSPRMCLPASTDSASGGINGSFGSGFQSQGPSTGGTSHNTSSTRDYSLFDMSVVERRTFQMESSPGKKFIFETLPLFISSSISFEVSSPMRINLGFLFANILV